MTVRRKKEHDELQYRVYLTDCLQAITESTAKMVGGKYFKKRYIDLVQPQGKKRNKAKPADTRTGPQIASDIIGKLAGAK